LLAFSFLLYLSGKCPKCETQEMTPNTGLFPEGRIGFVDPVETFYEKNCPTTVSEVLSSSLLQSRHQNGSH
jgi:hypothetical protein